MDGRMQNMSHIKQSASPAARRNFPDHKERVEGFRILQSGPSVSNQSCERLWVGQKRPSGKMTAAVTYWTFNGPNGRLVVMNLSCLSPPRLTEDRPAEWNTAEDSDSPLQKTTDETSFTRSSVSAGFWTRGKIVGVRLSFKTPREERERDREEEEKKL